MKRIVGTIILTILVVMTFAQAPRNTASCVEKVTATYDVVVVGGGPAGIGAALAAVKTGARTALIERDSRIGGTKVQAEVCNMGLCQR